MASRQKNSLAGCAGCKLTLDGRSKPLGASLPKNLATEGSHVGFF